MLRVIDRLVDWWLRKCKHDSAHVVADVLEGDGANHSVAYCRRCGALQVRYHHDHPDKWMRCRVGRWLRPRPLWFPTDKAPGAGGPLEEPFRGNQTYHRGSALEWMLGQKAAYTLAKNDADVVLTTGNGVTPPAMGRRQ
jgi:hypothetical protein